MKIEYGDLWALFDSPLDTILPVFSVSQLIGYLDATFRRPILKGMLRISDEQIDDLLDPGFYYDPSPYEIQFLETAFRLCGELVSRRGPSFTAGYLNETQRCGNTLNSPIRAFREGDLGFIEKLIKRIRHGETI